MLFLTRVRTRTGPLTDHLHRDTQFENLIRDRGVRAAKARLGRVYDRVADWAWTGSHSELKSIRQTRQRQRTHSH